MVNEFLEKLSINHDYVETQNLEPIIGDGCKYFSSTERTPILRTRSALYSETIPSNKIKFIIGDYAYMLSNVKYTNSRRVNLHLHSDTGDKFSLEFIEKFIDNNDWIDRYINQVLQLFFGNNGYEAYSRIDSEELKNAMKGRLDDEANKESFIETKLFSSKVGTVVALVEKNVRISSLSSIFSACFSFWMFDSVLEKTSEEKVETITVNTDNVSRYFYNHCMYANQIKQIPCLHSAFIGEENTLRNIENISFAISSLLNKDYNELECCYIYDCNTCSEVMLEVGDCIMYLYRSKTGYDVNKWKVGVWKYVTFTKE